MDRFGSEGYVCQLNYIVEVFHKLKVQLCSFFKSVFKAHIQYSMCYIFLLTLNLMKTFAYQL